MGQESDVIVVGAGPAGLTVACELALAGVQVTVLERRTEPVGSRASTLMPRVMEVLEMRDMLPRFIDRARQIRDGALLPSHSWAGMTFDWRFMDTPFPYRLLLPQNHTEELLKTRALELGVRIREGITVVAVDQDDESVRLSCREQAGPLSEFVAQFVVGADGGRSAVRKGLGINFAGHDGTFTGVAADAVMPFPWEDSARMVFGNEHGWLSMLPFAKDNSITRFVFVHAEGMHRDKEEPVTAEEIAAYAGQISGVDLDVRELAWSSRFTDAMRIADKFREGRVVLVGESTRIHYPASGVGMNFCMQDAFNLGWKLAAVVHEHARPALLDTFEAERRPVMLGLLESVKTQCSIQFDFSPGGLATKQFFEKNLIAIPEVSRRLAQDENGVLIAYPVADGVPAHDLCGRPVPNLALVTPEGRMHVLELLRQGTFVLVDLTGRAGWSISQASWKVGKASPLPVKIVPAQLSGEVEEMSGVTAFLLRPDGYIAYVATGSDDEYKGALDAAAALLIGP